jgi:hypothetical protein
MSMQAKNATVSRIDVFVNLLEAGGTAVKDATSVAAQVPFAVIPAQRRLTQAIPDRVILSEAPKNWQLRALGSTDNQAQLHRPAHSPRFLKEAPQGPYFDVDGDGAFSALDYMLFVQLSVAWSGTYATDASKWLQKFQQLTNLSSITYWQLQSTDPDFLYASLYSLPAFTHYSSAVSLHSEAQCNVNLPLLLYKFISCPTFLDFFIGTVKAAAPSVCSLWRCKN